MSINFRNSAASLVVVLIVGGLLWTWVVVSYDPELTTVNTFEANDTESSVSNSSDDALVSIEITSGEDVLGWDQLGICCQCQRYRHCNEVRISASNGTART